MGEEFAISSPSKNMYEEIDKIIKERQEKKRIKEDIDLAIKEKDKVITQLVQARRDLEKTRNDRDKFIKEREIEMKQRFLELENKLVRGQRILSELGAEANKVALDIGNTLKSALDGSLSLASRADQLVERAEYLKKQAEATIEALNKAKEDLDIKIIKNSELEKEISKREKDVEIKNKKADQKLEEARDLVFWHKTPGSGTIKE